MAAAVRPKMSYQLYKDSSQTLPLIHLFPLHPVLRKLHRFYQNFCVPLFSSGIHAVVRRQFLQYKLPHPTLPFPRRLHYGYERYNNHCMALILYTIQLILLLLYKRRANKPTLLKEQYSLSPLLF